MSVVYLHDFCRPYHPFSRHGGFYSAIQSRDVSGLERPAYTTAVMRKVHDKTCRRLLYASS